MSNGRLLFCSEQALHPPLMRVAEIMADTCGLEGHVLAPQEFRVPAVRHPSGMLSARGFEPSSTPLHVHFLPARRGDVCRFGFESAGLRALLREITPDYVWVHAEFWEGIARQFLWHYRLRRRPRIVAYVAINHVPEVTPILSARWPFLSRTRLCQLLLWPRLDGVAACATKSMECARRMGLPARVPVVVNYLPVFGPEHATQAGVRLPWQGDDAFVIGFAGMLTEQKGWRVLLEALELLPRRFKAVLVGDGEQRAEVEQWLTRPLLRGRVHCTGALPQETLLATYPAFDAFVLPSVTMPASVEQFGCVLAEAMACGVPVIGSSSGAIPETIGDAGLVVPEGAAAALAEAVVRMSTDQELRRRCVSRGMERFRARHSCEAYAASLSAMLGLQLSPRPAPARSAAATDPDEQAHLQPEAAAPRGR